MSIILFFARVLTNILFCDKIIFVIEGRSSLSPSVRECAVGASASEEYAKVALLDSGRTAVCLLEPDGEHRYMRKRGGYYPQNQVVPRFFRPEQIKSCSGLFHFICPRQIKLHLHSILHLRSKLHCKATSPIKRSICRW